MIIILGMGLFILVEIILWLIRKVRDREPKENGVYEVFDNAELKDEYQDPKIPYDEVNNPKEET